MPSVYHLIIGPNLWTYGYVDVQVSLHLQTFPLKRSNQSLVNVL
eukprot:gene5649-6519_t